MRRRNHPSHPARDDKEGVAVQIPQRLGIGFGYSGIVSPELYQTGLLDFVELTPESLCREQRTSSNRRIELIPDQVERARRTCDGLPLVVHGVELSIGSAHDYNTAYLDMLERLQATWPFVWHSEHLSFQTVVNAEGTTVEIGVPLPLPPTDESVSLVSERAAAIRTRFGVPFLLENPAHYLLDLPSDPDVGDEIELMRQITVRSGCGQLLDLHNLYCNALNHGRDALAMIDRISLERVVEIHVAGGVWSDGFWTDAHSGAVPPPVWELLEYTLPRSPNVAGVVFEIMEQHIASFGERAIEGELRHAREIWERFGAPDGVSELAHHAPR